MSNYTMTNKEYKQARELAENADALFEFEHIPAGAWFASRCMDADALKDMRRERREQVKAGAVKLDGCGVRAVVLTDADGGRVLRSYNTDVAAWRGGRLVKLWDGYSVTTLKHVNAFADYVGAARVNKREWIEMPVE